MRGIVLILLVIGSLAAPRVAAAQLLSPGPLSHAHKNLDDDDQCSRCHESGKQVSARLCLDCHQDLATALAAGRGLHGKQYKGKPCEQCHVEHIGRNTKLIRWPGGAMEKLDHTLTGWSLDGGHAKVTCLKCHTKSSPLGKPQFLGTKTTCAGCHKDPHAGRFGTACQTCHGVMKWDDFDRQRFDHKLAKFPLTGKHTAVACEKCHLGTPPRWKPVGFATCEACHKDPHQGSFRPRPCTACHDTGSWDSAADKMRNNHPGLSLASGHARVACESCHDRGNNKPPSKGRACVSCHKQVHVAKFGTRCEGCHGAIKWVGLRESIGRDNHGKTRYPLAGKHAGVDCARCHPANKPLARRFRGVAFDRCTACHADDHQGEFAARDQGECAQCHTVGGFTPTTFGLAAHATTPFALDGKHTATPCGSCHTARRPRLEFRLAKRACADCHDNPHGAQFAVEMARGGCATCHTTADWHQPSIDHATWPLEGAHGRAACASCHGEQHKGAEPASYRGIPRACEGCHDDIHAGQFGQTQPVKACTACHDATSFEVARTFDHDKTRYPLRGKHQPLACTACHKPETLRNGTSVVRWRLGYVQCKDCHANPHREGP